MACLNETEPPAAEALGRYNETHQHEIQHWRLAVDWAEFRHRVRLEARRVMEAQKDKVLACCSVKIKVILD